MDIGIDLSQLGPAAFAALATGAGAPVWSLLIMGLIDTVKAVPEFRRIVDGHERLAAFLLSAVVTAAAFAVGLSIVPPTTNLSIFGIVLAVLSWFTVARLSMALHDDKEKAPGSLTAAGPPT
jgi:hypothetical protein